MPFAFSISVLRKGSACNIHHRCITRNCHIHPTYQSTDYTPLGHSPTKVNKFTRPIRAISDTTIKFNQIITKET